MSTVKRDCDAREVSIPSAGYANYFWIGVCARAAGCMRNHRGNLACRGWLRRR